MSRTAPKRLDESGREIWDETLPLLEEAFGEGVVNYAILEQYCDTTARIRVLAVKTRGKEQVKNTRGNVRMNPDYKVYFELLKQQRAYATMLGIDVATRKRIEKMVGDGASGKKGKGIPEAVQWLMDQKK